MTDRSDAEDSGNVLNHLIRIVPRRHFDEDQTFSPVCFDSIIFFQVPADTLQKNPLEIRFIHSFKSDFAASDDKSIFFFFHNSAPLSPCRSSRQYIQKTLSSVSFRRYAGSPVFPLYRGTLFAAKTVSLVSSPLCKKDVFSSCSPYVSAVPRIPSKDRKDLPQRRFADLLANASIFLFLVTAAFSSFKTASISSGVF